MQLNREYNKKLRPHYEQTKFFLSKKRYRVAVAGRGSGKTEIARKILVGKMTERKVHPGALYLYGLPTQDQARRVAWEPLLKMIPEALIKGTPNQARMTLTLINGATLKCAGLEKPHRLEGVQYDGVIIDESSDVKPGVFDVNLGPAMTHRNAWALRIGVPKRRGIGGAEFRDFFLRGLRGDPDIDSFTWKSSTVLSPEEIEKKKQVMSLQDYNEQYEASWENAQGLIYYAFSDRNIDPAAIYMQHLPIYVLQDFNVSPMSWCLAHFIHGVLYVFDEIYELNINTASTLSLLHKRYPFHEAGWRFIGDASQKGRHTSSNVTDYMIIEADERFKPKTLIKPKKNPYIYDRFACVNAALCNAKGTIRIRINPKCKKLIRDLEMYAYKPLTSDPDQSNKELSHISDALGYGVVVLMPMESDNQNTGKVIIA